MSKDGGSGSIPEEHTGVAILPIDDAAELIGTDDSAIPNIDSQTVIG